MPFELQQQTFTAELFQICKVVFDVDLESFEILYLTKKQLAFYFFNLHLVLVFVLNLMILI